MIKKDLENKVIFHLDVDAFFVSSELTLRPELKNHDIAITVGLDNSIVSSLSYSAKNKGAKVPMKVKEVKKYCPNLVCLKPNFNLYSHLSNQIYQYLFKNYTKAIEIGSIDEWFLDVTKIWSKFKSVKNLAKAIQTKIKQKFNLDVSIGISYNKFLAKIATDLNKPLGISIINHQNFQAKIWDLPIEKYWGIGKTLANQLVSLNIKTIGDLAKQNPDDEKLKQIFKNQIHHYINQANGIGASVINDDRNDLNIIANSLTFYLGPTNDYLQIINQLKAVALMVETRLKERCLKGDKLILSLKLAKNSQISTSLNLGISTNDFATIYQNALILLENFWKEQLIIGIGIGITNLSNFYENETIDLFENSKNNSVEPAQLAISLINQKLQKKVAFSLKEYQENKTLKANQSKYIK